MRPLLGVMLALGRAAVAGRARALVARWRARNERPDASVRAETAFEVSPLDEPALAPEAPSLKVQIRGQLREALQAKLRRPLRLEEEELPFSALGLDSIALLELASKLEERYDVTLADFAAYEHPTLVSLAAHVAELLEAKPAASGGAPAREPAAGASSAARHELELPLWPIREGS